MSEVRLYDSRGYPLDDPDATRNDTIRDMSRYGVVFTISLTPPYRMVTYFRAHESASGRLEQYYATYTASGGGGGHLLAEFQDAVVEAAEQKHDLRVAESESGENILDKLDVDDPESAGTRRERERARNQLSQGRQLRFGVSSYEKAFKLIDDLADARSGLEIAVTEGSSSTTGPMSKYDLIIEKGNYSGLVPIGQTKQLMDPTPDVDRSQTQDQDEGLVPDAVVDVGAALAVLLALAVVYGVIAHLLWAPAPFVPVNNSTAVPGAAQVPGIHKGNITVNGSSGRNVTVSGKSPARTLHLYYYNQSGGRINNTTIAPTDGKRLHNFSVTKPVDGNVSSLSLVYEGWLFPRSIADCYIRSSKGTVTCSDAPKTAGTPNGTETATRTSASTPNLTTTDTNASSS